MSDLYVEHLVPRTTSSTQKVLKYVMIVLTVFVGLGALLLANWIVFLIFAACCAADFFLIPSFDLEYEYLYVNGELDVDKIMSKQKRKRIGSYNMENMELLAPYTSHELDHYKKDGNTKVVDYSSNTNSPQMYGMVINQDSKRMLLMLELNETIINDIRRIAPSKVRQF